MSYTIDDVMSKLNSLTSELREVRRFVEALQRNEVDRLDVPENGLVRDDGAVFLTGTGWTGRTSVVAAEPADDVPVSDLDRYLPKHLRTEQTDDQETA